MLTLKSPAEPQLADAALAWVRDITGGPVQVSDVATVLQAADTLWMASLVEVCPGPTWRQLALYDHVTHPVTFLAGALLGHRQLHILAAAMERANGFSLALAAARPCAAGPGRYNITQITPYPMAEQLAAALQADAVDADFKHTRCKPVHQSPQAIACLDRAEASRQRRESAY